MRNGYRHSWASPVLMMLVLGLLGLLFAQTGVLVPLGHVFLVLLVFTALTAAAVCAALAALHRSGEDRIAAVRTWERD